MVVVVLFSFVFVLFLLLGFGVVVFCFVFCYWVLGLLSFASSGSVLSFWGVLFPVPFSVFCWVIGLVVCLKVCVWEGGGRSAEDNVYMCVCCFCLFFSVHLLFYTPSPSFSSLPSCLSSFCLFLSVLLLFLLIFSFMTKSSSCRTVCGPYALCCGHFPSENADMLSG